MLVPRNEITDYMAKAGGRSSVPLMGVTVKPAMCFVIRELKELIKNGLLDG
jgi:hypothetical protein